MTATISRIIKNLWQLILLFMAYQIFWLLFYFLSSSGLLEYGLWYSYFKQAVVNSIGFIAAVLAAYWLFPKFLSSKKIALFIATTCMLIIVFGSIQYIAQDWRLSDRYTPPLELKENAIPAMTLRQANGAQVYAMLNVTVYILLGLGYGYMKDNIKKEKQARALEKEKIQAELSLLRYQINPHFLFNTINDIYYLAIIQSNKTADALLQLSNILRYVLNEKEEMVPLDREIEYLEQFIQLHHFRFPEEVIHKDFQLSAQHNQYRIAPLLLITFIENAFKHGQPEAIDSPTSISLKVQGKKLHYEVINKINPNAQKVNSAGIGLPNLKRRLALLYPEKHLFKTAQNDTLFIAQLEIDLYD